MSREEKIQAIYNVMVNKKLCIGCQIQVIEPTGPCMGMVFAGDNDSFNVVREDHEITTITRKVTGYEIIGRPVMIGDVLNYCSSYISDGDDSVDSQIDLLSYWGDYRLPIEDQPEECIDFVHSFIQKN